MMYKGSSMKQPPEKRFSKQIREWHLSYG